MAEVNATELSVAGSYTDAREQAAYCTLGELAQACGVISDWEKQARSLRNEILVLELGLMQQELDKRLARERVRLRAQRGPS